MPNTPETPESIAKKLEAFAEFLRKEYLGPKHFDGWPGLPVPSPRPKRATLKGANLFLLGSIIDFRQKAWRAWGKARRFLGETVPEGDRVRPWHWIASHSLTSWVERKRTYDLHWIPDRHQKIHFIAQQVVQQYDGDPRRIWEHCDGSRVRQTFERTLQVGEYITHMIVGALRDHNLITLEASDFKPDTHVCKMMHILGLSSSPNPREVLEAGQRWFRDPWLVDGALWELGKDYEIQSREEFLDIYKAMTTWLRLKDQVSKLVQSVTDRSLRGALPSNGWNLEFEETHHWAGIYLKRTDGPLAAAMQIPSNCDLWAWVGVGFYKNLVLALDVGGDPKYFSDSVLRILRRLNLREEHHASSGCWGMREFYYSLPIQDGTMTDRDWMQQTLEAKLRDLQYFVRAVESNMNA